MFDLLGCLTVKVFTGNCRAYGGSDHLTLDLESHGFQLLDEANNDDDDNGEVWLAPG